MQTVLARGAAADEGGLLRDPRADREPPDSESGVQADRAAAVRERAAADEAGAAVRLPEDIPEVEGGGAEP